MKTVCSQCQTEMIVDCQVRVEYGAYGIKISQKGRGPFGGVSAKPKASVCPNCGHVEFYIEEFEKFQK